MSDVALKVENLGKKYIIGHQNRERYTALRDVLTNQARNFGKRMVSPFKPTLSSYTKEEFWALKDVSFEVKKGEVVGIIGRNGAGKSTLLKILSRITEPTTGRITLEGQVASLLEVGTGFHPELTGRENIFLNGAILGMSQADIKRKFDEIVDFAEIEKFLDTPVKRYSSGMYVRLAFAVAAHMEPEILVVDEVLAVGDAAFQKKCLGKMGDVASKEGRTVLFVSHNMSAITQLCTKGIYLKTGVLIQNEQIDKAVNTYLLAGTSEDSFIDLTINSEGFNRAKKMYFRKIGISPLEGENSNELDIRHPFKIGLEYEVVTPISNAEISVRIDTSTGLTIFTTFESDCDPSSKNRKPGIYEVEIIVPKMFLMPGTYFITVAAHNPMVEMYDFYENIIRFTINDTGTNYTIYGDYQKVGIIINQLKWKETVLAH